MRWLIALLVVVGLGFGGRSYILYKMEAGLIRVHPKGARTPEGRGLPYESLSVHSGDRALPAFYVPADGPGLLIFHGNGEAISGWVDALKILHDAGIAAMVFDYTGFGGAQGR